uniref:Uncharacterized protein AlNc14C301G10379 n=1 Tax=Albugo laibachii Nc14 TaxID=890382 RepID=F0WVP1_9STRA|nr:conserved hypothetical protein [Albugo laibachii Nc14]|eukprot:CCA25486.1 conserved hypothetical protein [Albugo laibachii Nc14]
MSKSMGIRSTQHQQQPMSQSNQVLHLEAYQQNRSDSRRILHHDHHRVRAQHSETHVHPSMAMNANELAMRIYPQSHTTLITMAQTHMSEVGTPNSNINPVPYWRAPSVEVDQYKNNLDLEFNDFMVNGAALSAMPLREDSTPIPHEGSNMCIGAIPPTFQVYSSMPGMGIQSNRMKSQTCTFVPASPTMRLRTQPDQEISSNRTQCFSVRLGSHTKTKTNVSYQDTPHTDAVPKQSETIQYYSDRCTQYPKFGYSSGQDGNSIPSLAIYTSIRSSGSPSADELDVRQKKIDERNEKCEFHNCLNRARVSQIYGKFCNRHVIVAPCGFPGCRDKAMNKSSMCVKHLSLGKDALHRVLANRAQNVPVCKTLGCFKNDQGRGHCRGHEKLLMATGRLPKHINKRRLNSAYTMCSYPHCSKHSQRNHLCRTHGNLIIKQAREVAAQSTDESFDEILTRLQKDVKRCTHPNCTKNSQRDRLCTMHYHEKNNTQSSGEKVEAREDDQVDKDKDVEGLKQEVENSDRVEKV